jgi:hypothetical protein
LPPTSTAGLSKISAFDLPQPFQFVECNFDLVHLSVSERRRKFRRFAPAPIWSGSERCLKAIAERLIGQGICFNSLDHVLQHLVEDIDPLGAQPICVAQKQISDPPERLDPLFG